MQKTKSKFVCKAGLVSVQVRFGHDFEVLLLKKERRI